MKEQIKDLWVAALRSGKYQQGKAYLNRGFKFCCMGVLCELAIENGVAIERQLSKTGFPERYDYIGTYEGRPEVVWSLPPTAVTRWAGLNSMTGAFNIGPNERSLVTMNDEASKSFLEIADIIERHWQEL